MNGLNERYLMRIFANANKLNNIPSQTNPVLIIKYGPPASGKGSQYVKDVIKSFGFPPDSYININVDDVVESLNIYKTQSRKTLQNKGVNPNDTVEKINKILNKASNQNASNFLLPYTNIRFNPKLNIPKQMDALMKNAIIGKKNITFETSGATGFPFWIFENMEGLNNYNIKCLFPLLPVSQGWSRYKNRAITSYKKGGVFRFGLTKIKYKENYLKSYKQFLNGEQKLRNLKSSFHVIDSDGKQHNKNYRDIIQTYINGASANNKTNRKSYVMIMQLKDAVKRLQKCEVVKQNNIHLQNGEKHTKKRLIDSLETMIKDLESGVIIYHPKNQQ